MGRFTILLQDGSQTILAVVQDVKGRRRKLICAVVVGLLVLGAAGFGLFRHMSTEAAETFRQLRHALTMVDQSLARHCFL